MEIFWAQLWSFDCSYVKEFCIKQRFWPVKKGMSFQNLAQQLDLIQRWRSQAVLWTIEPFKLTCLYIASFDPCLSLNDRMERAAIHEFLDSPFTTFGAFIFILSFPSKSPLKELKMHICVTMIQGNEGELEFNVRG